MGADPVDGVIKLFEGGTKPTLTVKWRNGETITGWSAYLRILYEGGGRKDILGTITVDGDPSADIPAEMVFEFEPGDLPAGTHVADVELFDGDAAIPATPPERPADGKNLILTQQILKVRRSVWHGG